MARFKNRIPELLTRKELRDKARYSQKEFAEGTGLTGAAISRIMNHDTIDKLTYASAVAIAQWLGVPMEELAETDIDEDEGE